MMSRIVVFALVTMAGWLVCANAMADDPDFIETHEFLHVVIGGKPYRLDSLVVKKSGATGPLPIALITSGTGRSEAEVKAERAENYAPQARDLALRGWLAVVVIRRGIGRSGGLLATDRCGRLHVERDLNAAADDLQAAIEVLKRRPDADPSRIIAIGVSTGGASVVALGARNPPGLVGVVSVSGGIRFNCPGWDDNLVAAYKKFGATSHVPSLWLYAKNDSVFDPDLVERVRTAFVLGGSDVDLRELEPLKQEGHLLFSEGRMRWLERLDYFLQYNHVPTWNYDEASGILKQLNLPSSKLRFVQEYLIAPTPKAMTFSPGTRHAYFQYAGRAGPAANRDAAMSRCENAGNADCRIVMENNRWVGPMTQ